jgi:hypothetical protein
MALSLETCLWRGRRSDATQDEGQRDDSDYSAEESLHQKAKRGCRRAAPIAKRFV